VRRTPSYRADLVEAIRKHLPRQFFARWPLPKGLTWTPQRLVWMALLMTGSAEQTLADRFDAVRDLLKAAFPHWRLGVRYTGWFEARARWLPPVQSAAARRRRRQMAAVAGRHWTREGWCALAADGSRGECPRTAANERGLGCAGKERTAPQLFLTALWHLGTGLPRDFRIGPGTASERRPLEDRLADLPPRALVVADAGFSGYDRYRRIVAARRSFLLRVGSNVHWLRKLGVVRREGASVVYLWPEKHGHEPPLVLRLIELRRGRKKMYLVTNERDEAAWSRKSAGVLYEMRWGVEGFFRSCKQTLQKRKMLSRTPEAARCELTWAVLGVWLLGVMSVAGIIAGGGDPLRWSVARARQRVRRAMRRVGKARRRGPSLREQWGRATQDDYRRPGSKKARNWPHKKKERPPGEPEIEGATPEQVRRAKRFAAPEVAA
jgi:DDE family transposase